MRVQTPAIVLPRLLWHTDPRVYIAVHPNYPADITPSVTLWGWHDVRHSWNWQGQEGQVFKVEVYSNCDEVELFLDDRSLGCRPCSRTERFKTTFELPSQPGTLRATGYVSGKPVTEQVIAATRNPAQTRLTADRSTIQADGSDLYYITVEVLDEEGRLHPTADDNFYFTMKGAGKILAVGNGNPMSEELYVGNQGKLYRGRALVVVKSTDEAGDIRLTAQADGINGAEIVIKSENST